VTNSLGVAPLGQVDDQLLPTDPEFTRQLAESYESVPWVAAYLADATSPGALTGGDHSLTRHSSIRRYPPLTSWRAVSWPMPSDGPVTKMLTIT
jgi:hypothetical protein